MSASASRSSAVLDGVNEHMTGPELNYVTMAHLELTGNFYWLLDGVTSDTDQPRAIYPLNPGRVRVKLNKSSFPYKISHYEFTLDGKVFRVADGRVRLRRSGSRAQPRDR